MMCELKAGHRIQSYSSYSVVARVSRLLSLRRLAARQSPVRFAPVIMNEVIHIFRAVQEGDPHAASRLLPLVYDELRRLAAWQLAREPAGQTLQPTALVHEAFLRLVARPGAAGTLREPGPWVAAFAPPVRVPVAQRPGVATPRRRAATGDSPCAGRRPGECSRCG